MISLVEGAGHAGIPGLAIALEPSRVEDAVLIMDNRHAPELEQGERDIRQIGRIAQRVDHGVAPPTLRKGVPQPLDLDQWPADVAGTGSAVKDPDAVTARLRPTQERVTGERR